MICSSSWQKLSWVDGALAEAVVVVVVLRLAAGLFVASDEDVFRESGLGAKDRDGAEEAAVDVGMEKLSCDAAVLAGAVPNVKAGGAPEEADGANAIDVCV